MTTSKTKKAPAKTKAKAKAKAKAEPKTAYTKLAVGLVIDRSGSMQPNWKQTIGACNEYIQSLMAKDTDSTITVTAFDDKSIDIVRDGVPVKDCKLLKPDEFPPRGLTPLYDAVGHTISALETRPAAAGEGVALVVMTDGAENASTDYTLERLSKLLAEKQKKENWLVLFLGQGLAAWQQAAGLNVAATNAVNFTPENVNAVYRAASASTMSYMSTGSTDASQAFAGLRDGAATVTPPKKATPSPSRRRGLA